MTSIKLLLLSLLFVLQGLLSACQTGNTLNRLPVTAISIVDEWNEACVDAYQSRAELVHALDLSLNWFNKIESHAFYPIAGITHEEARANTSLRRK